MRTAPLVLLLATMTGTGLAQGYVTDFEGLLASNVGTSITGQDNYYLPAVAGSVDGQVWTYVGNTLGVPVNANGGLNFYAGVSQGGTAFARAQRALTLPTGRIRIEYDVCCLYNGAAVTPTNNIGSFSFQPSTNAIYVNLLAAYPTGVAYPPTTWDANVVTRGAAPPATVTTVLPDPAFQGLAMGVWHRWAVTVDLGTGEHVEFTIRNGVTGLSTTYVPTTPLLLPIAPGIGAPLPTDFRLFTGGGAGNVFAVDNLLITDGAEYVAFGTGCPGALGVPGLAAAPGSAPKLGGTLTVDVTGLPVNIALMITGLSDQFLAGSIPLPLPLATQGFPGCSLLVDMTVTQTLVGAGNTAQWSFPVPNNFALIGFTLFNQAASLDPGPAFLAFSNGGRARIGL